jgi:hypothetical protein
MDMGYRRLRTWKHSTVKRWSQHFYSFLASHIIVEHSSTLASHRRFSDLDYRLHSRINTAQPAYWLHSLHSVYVFISRNN